MSRKNRNFLIYCVLFITVLGTVLGNNELFQNSEFDNVRCPKSSFLQGNNYECFSDFGQGSWQAVPNSNPSAQSFKARFVTASSIYPSAQNQRVVALHKFDSSQNKQQYCVRQVLKVFPYGEYKLKASYVLGGNQDLQPHQVKMFLSFYTNNSNTDPFSIQIGQHIPLRPGEDQIVADITVDRSQKSVIFVFCDMNPADITGYTIGLKKITLERKGDKCPFNYHSVWFNDESTQCKASDSISQSQLNAQFQCKVWKKFQPNQCQSHIQYCKDQEYEIQQINGDGTKPPISRIKYTCTQCFSFYKKDTDYRTCIPKQPHQLIPHCVVLEPDSFTLCKQCEPGYTLYRDKNVCLKISWNDYIRNSEFENEQCPKQNFLSGNNYECFSWFNGITWYAVPDKKAEPSEFKARFVTASSIYPSTQNQRVVALHRYVNQNKQQYCLRQTFDRFPYGEYRINVSYVLGHQSNFQSNQARMGFTLYDDSPQYQIHFQWQQTLPLSTAGQHQISFSFYRDRTSQNVIFFICDQTSSQYPGYSIGVKKISLERIGDHCQQDQYEVWLNDGSVSCKALNQIPLTQFTVQSQCKVWSKDIPNVCESHIEYCARQSQQEYQSQIDGSIIRYYSCDSCFSFAQTIYTNKTTCVPKPTSESIDRCTAFEPGNFGLCRDCQQNYLLSSDQTYCYRVFIGPNHCTILGEGQKQLPTSFKDFLNLYGLVHNQCAVSSKLVRYCAIHQYIQDIVQDWYECKTCKQGWAVINVQIDGNVHQQCLKIDRTVEDCQLYAQFMNTCLYKCISCSAGKQLGNVKFGSRIIQNCLSLENQFLPHCDLYYDDNRTYYCHENRCTAPAVQIPIGTGPRQLACTTFALLDGSNGKGQCQIYQRPKSTDTELKCTQCKDPSKQLPYCS